MTEIGRRMAARRRAPPRRADWVISQPPSPAKKHLKLASKMSAPKKAKTTRRGAAVIGQSGGPTVVINQSL
eukprot:COSAG01_NODE_44835_length_415_cov_0.743671_1_plen_70_part_10